MFSTAENIWKHKGHSWLKNPKKKQFNCTFDSHNMGLFVFTFFTLVRKSEKQDQLNLVELGHISATNECK